MMKSIRNAGFTLAAIAAAVPAWALSLEEGRSSGVVGERADGYVASVASPTAEVRALISEVNTKRKAEYQKIAAGNGQALDVVEKLAAQKIIDRLPSGTYVQGSDGKWVKK